MTICAYSQLYLSRVSRAVGNMLHYATRDCILSGADFLERFIQSGVAKEIENGNPKYIAGKSGYELFLEVTEKTAGESLISEVEANYDRSPEYWVGWMLTHYQWHSGKSFKSILDTVPYDELRSLYGILHEADIHKSYNVMEAHFAGNQSKLKSVRKRSGLTQDELAERSGVSVNTIRSYERKSKDLNKARFEIVARLARALKCETLELLE